MKYEINIERTSLEDHSGSDITSSMVLLHNHYDITHQRCDISSRVKTFMLVTVSSTVTLN
jgi:hypothetical protein